MHLTDRRLNGFQLSIGAALCIALVLVLAGSPATASAHSPSSGATVTFALQPNEAPTYILPLESAEQDLPPDISYFQNLMFRPLYWYGLHGKVAFNAALSLAAAPTYSNDGRTATIKLKRYMWSDGVPLTSRDVEFWLNELKAEKDVWYAYLPGSFPDTLVDATYPNASTVVLTFNQAYSHQWLFYNVLSQIIPIPQKSWDRTSSTGPVGNYDLTLSGAQAVYSFLAAQASDLATYATNPLWQVVDGPFRLQSYIAANGYTVFVPNVHYSGAPKATIAKLIELPFTSDAAEFTAVLSGKVDYGYVPATDTPTEGTLRAKGYRIATWPIWGIAYAMYNFTNPTAGALFKQLYFRQALQHLVNQPEYIKDFWAGTAIPTYGPVPLSPTTPYLTHYEASNPYPYSLADATRLLVNHGWVKGAGGVLVCQRPGSGASECGSGVAKGATAAFQMIYPSGTSSYTDQIAALASTALRVGVHISVKGEPISELASVTVPCASTGSGSCPWAMSWRFGWSWSPDYYPTADLIFGTGAAANSGGYSSQEADRLIAAGQLVSGYSAIEQQENYFARDLPVLYLPGFPFQVSAIKKNISGAVPQDPIGNIYPEQWVVG